MSDNILEMRGITKEFPGVKALDNVNFEVKKGSIHALVGENGAGKSTLMKILIGLWKADSGTVQVPANIGYLPENNPLYEEMYVSEYLSFMYSLETAGADRPLTLTDRFADRVQTLIERVGLTPEKHKHIRELSKGYRQRVGLAQALLGDPDLLILDEPTTGLDPNQLVEIRSLIRSLGRDRTVILSTHIMQEVREMCDRVVILDHGQVKTDELICNIPDLEQLFHEMTQ